MNFKNKPILGMIHLAGEDSTKTALEEAEIMFSEGVDGILVENYHGSIENVRDALLHLKDYKGILGLNILPNNFQLAFEFAHEFNADFIQLDYVAGVYGHSPVINEQHYFDIKNKYPNVNVLGGIWPKYYEPIKGSILKDDIDVGIKRTEAIVVTGSGTGKETPLDKIKQFRELCGEHALIIGAGLTPSNVKEQLSIANGAIVGSTFKPYGITTQKIQRSLVKEFMDEVKKVRNDK